MTAPSVVVAVHGSRFVRRAVIAMLAGEAALIVLDLVVNRGELFASSAIRRLCNIAREDGLANFYKSLLFLLSAATLWTIRALVRREVPTPPVSRRLGWTILAIFFTYLAIDDATALHERVGTAIDDASGRHAASAAVLGEDLKSYTWQIVFLPIFGAVGVYLMFFLRTALATTRLRLTVFAALALWVVAESLDWVQGLEQDVDQHPVFRPIALHFSRTTDSVAHFAQIVEESLEMLGAILFLSVFLTQLARIARSVEVQFRET